MTTKHCSAAESFIPYAQRFQSSTSEKAVELSPVFTPGILPAAYSTAELIQEKLVQT